MFNSYAFCNFINIFYYSINFRCANSNSTMLSKITSYFNDANISVEKILQIPDNNSESIPILITTHKIKSSKLLSSVKKIADLNFVFENISVIPIEH